MSRKGKGRAATPRRESGTKVCGKCGRRKQLAAFARDRMTHDGRRRICKECDNARRSAHRASVEADRRRSRRLLLILWMGGCCVSCDETDPAQLEFDHIDPATKRTTVSALLDTGTWESILAEAAKCQLLCVGCHKLKTARERQARALAASLARTGSPSGYTLACAADGYLYIDRVARSSPEATD